MLIVRRVFRDPVKSRTQSLPSTYRVAIIHHNHRVSLIVLGQNLHQNLGLNLWLNRGFQWFLKKLRLGTSSRFGSLNVQNWQKRQEKLMKRIRQRTWLIFLCQSMKKKIKPGKIWSKSVVRCLLLKGSMEKCLQWIELNQLSKKYL